MNKIVKKKNVHKLIDSLYQEIGKKIAFLHEPHIFGNEHKQKTRLS